MGIWFVKEERGVANSFLMPQFLSQEFWRLISGAIFTAYGNNPGWRYLFIYEGILALISVAILWVVLTDFPEDAKWLTKDEKDALERELKNEEENKPIKVSWKEALKQRDVILLTIVYFLGVTGLYGYTIWLPSIIKSMANISAATASFLSDIPYVVAAIALILILRFSDKKEIESI